jgi:DNA polymerase-1
MLHGVRAHLIASLDDALAFRAWLGERRPVLAVDTETGGLEWWRVPLRLVQLGDAQDAWSIPWGLWGGVAKEALEKYAAPMTMHNRTYDLHMLNENGVHPRRWLIHDTSVMAHIQDSTRSRALKPLCTRLVDPQASVGQHVLKEAMRSRGWTWGTVPVDYPPYWAYGALDTVLTARLFEVLAPGITTSPVYDLEMSLSAILQDMETRGVHVDVDYLAEQARNLRDSADSALTRGSAEHGINLASSQALGTRLEELGARLTKRTMTGRPCVDVHVLEDIVTAGRANASLAGPAAALAELVLGARTDMHFASAYFEKMLELHDSGVLHANIDSLGARTARMSVSRPPLQQLPSHSPLVRDAFVAPPGYKLVSIDFDQIEIRLLAHFAEEPSMIHAIRSGEDLHWAAARMLYGPDATPEQRKLVKSAAFGKIYGIGPAKFAVAQGVSLQEAQGFLSGYDEMFPGVKDFIQGVQGVGASRHRAQGRAWVRTPIGRTHYLRPEEDRAYYKLVNYLIQGAAADVLKERIIALDNAGFGEYLRLPVHDEMIFQFPEDGAEELAREAQSVMQDLDTYRVPLSAEASPPMTRWGDRYDPCLTGRHGDCSRRFCTCPECGSPGA